MGSTKPCMVIGVVLLMASPSGFAGEEALLAARVDPSYEGKYAYETVLKHLDRFSKEAPQAYRKACAALGLPHNDADRPWVRIRDGAPFLPARTRLPAAKTFAEECEGGLRLVVLFNAEYLANGSGDPGQRLLHEMVHAAMRRAQGDKRYKKVPVWLREGIALSVAGQGFSRVRFDFSVTLDAASMLDGLAGCHKASDYAEDFLAVDFMRKRGGPGSLVRLMSLLLSGMEPDRAVEKVADLEAGTFERAFYREVLPQLAAKAEPDLAKFLPAYRLFQQGEYAAALERFQRIEWGTGGKGGVLAGALEGKAFYYRAKCLFQLGRVPEARACFTRVRTEYASACGLADDAAFFEAECLLREGKVSNAREAFHRFVRDYPYSNFAGEGWHKLGMCAYLLEDYAFAKQTCLATWKAFSDERVAENALYDAANSARAQGGREEALALFRTFCKRFPKSRFLDLARSRLVELEEGG